MSPHKGEHKPHGREVFSAERAGHLDTPLRRFLYRPDRLAERYIRPGDQILDFGCGPGFFTREFAKRAGGTGHVWSVDLQEEMLAILRNKLGPEGLLARITTHRCLPDTIGLPPDLNGTFDAAFTIFVVHEVPDREKLFREIFMLLKPGGRYFYTEPPFLVSGKEFAANLEMLKVLGFEITEPRWFFVNRAACMTKR